MQRQQINNINLYTAEENMTMYVQKRKYFAIKGKQHSSTEDKASRWGVTE